MRKLNRNVIRVRVSGTVASGISGAARQGLTLHGAKGFLIRLAQLAALDRPKERREKERVHCDGNQAHQVHEIHDADIVPKNSVIFFTSGV